VAVRGNKVAECLREGIGHKPRACLIRFNFEVVHRRSQIRIPQSRAGLRHGGRFAWPERCRESISPAMARRSQIRMEAPSQVHLSYQHPAAPARTSAAAAAGSELQLW